MNIYDLWLERGKLEGMRNTHKKKQANMIWYDKELKTSANMDYKLCTYMMKINGYEEICNRFPSFLQLHLTRDHFLQIFQILSCAQFGVLQYPSWQQQNNITTTIKVE